MPVAEQLHAVGDGRVQLRQRLLSVGDPAGVVGRSGAERLRVIQQVDGPVGDYAGTSR